MKTGLGFLMFLPAPARLSTQHLIDFASPPQPAMAPFLSLGVRQAVPTLHLMYKLCQHSADLFFLLGKVCECLELG